MLKDLLVFLKQYMGFFLVVLELLIFVIYFPTDTESSDLHE